MRLLLEKLRTDPAIRSFLVLVFGLILLDFFFALVFGGGNVMQRYLGLTSLLVELLVLVLVGVFFYGLFMVFRENAQPILDKIIRQNNSNIVCNTCGKNLQNGWKCCPICGSDVKDEGFKN